MSYRSQPFHQRFATLGDQAEAVYTDVLPLGNSTRFGFRRPEGIKFSSLPEHLRHTPDFVTATYLVEVVGLGKDGILKSIKVSKYEALKVWSKIAKMLGLMGLVLFVWNSAERQFLIIAWSDIVAEVAYSKKTFGIQKFENDQNEYYPIPWSRLVEKSTFIGSHDDDD
jgi:hypothetical protein